MLDEDNMKYLLESLMDDDPHVRVFTINSIVDNSNRKKAVNALINSLLDENSEVRARAAWALGKIGEKNAIKPLVQSLNDDDYTTRKNSLRSLGELVALEVIDDIILKLCDLHWDVRNEAAIVLDYLGWVPSNIKEQIYHLVAKGRWKEILELKNLNIEYLIPFLQDEESEVQRYVAGILGEIGDEKAIQPLFDLLMTAKYQDVKEKASLALGKIGGKKAVELLHVALHDSNWFIRKCAVTSLGMIKDETSITSLQTLSTDSNRFVRQSAKEALEKFSERK